MLRPRLCPFLSSLLMQNKALIEAMEKHGSAWARICDDAAYATILRRGQVRGVAGAQPVSVLPSCLGAHTRTAAVHR